MSDFNRVLTKLQFDIYRKIPYEYIFVPMMSKDYETALDDIGNMPVLSYTICKHNDVEIITHIDNEEETRNIANVGEIIVSGIKGELYVVKTDKFEKWYSNFDGYMGYTLVLNPVKREVAIAEQEIFDELGIEEVWFTAPWGEKMLLRPGDAVVRESMTEYYRVEKDAFEQTYEFACENF